MSKAESTDYFDAIKEYTIKELAAEQSQLKDKIDALKKEASRYQGMYDYIRNRLLPERMDEQGVESVRFEGIGRVSLTPVVQVSVPAAERENFYTWLEENGHGDIIRPYAQPSTVTALIKEQIQEGEEIPEDIVSINAFTQARITKG